MLRRRATLALGGSSFIIISEGVLLLRLPSLEKEVNAVSWTITEICAVIMAGCAVFGALFDIYKFHHRHDDESHNHRLSRWLEEALEGHNTSNP